jgi:uncharacterized damage-inducible protein DinB
MTNDLKQLFDRDLERLAVELKQYQKEANIWKIKGDINNSAGNLCLHLCGNLQHFIGHILNHTNYQRKRAREFGTKHLPIDVLLKEIDQTRKVLREYFEQLVQTETDKTYPIEVFGQEMTTGWFLLHLYGHLNYHIGQITYHRRLIEPT